MTPKATLIGLCSLFYLSALLDTADGQLFRRRLFQRSVQQKCGWLGCEMCYPELHQNSQTVVGPTAPSPKNVHAELIAALNLTKTDVLYDLGCGDGALLIAASQASGCRGIGVEIDPEIGAKAFRNVQASKLPITIVLNDVRKVDLSRADAVFMYLDLDLMAELVPKLRATRIVSYLHPIPGLENRRIETSNGPIFVAGSHVDYSMAPAIEGPVYEMPEAPPLPAAATVRARAICAT